MILAAIPWAWDWSPTAWAAIGACATFLVYVVIGLYAWRQVDEARKLRKEQARPWVVVDFEPGFLFWVSIENLGRTVATDVRIRFEPELASTMARPWEWEESTVLTDGIPLLPPGKRLRFFFDSYPERVSSDLPKAYDVFIEYHGPIKERTPLTSHYRLDLRHYYGMSPLPDGLPEIAKTLENIQKELHRWTDGSSGIRANVTDRDKASVRSVRHIWARRGLDIRKEKGWLAFGNYLIGRWLLRRGWIR